MIARSFTLGLGLLVLVLLLSASSGSFAPVSKNQLGVRQSECPAIPLNGLKPFDRIATQPGNFFESGGTYYHNAYSANLLYTSPLWPVQPALKLSKSLNSQTESAPPLDSSLFLWVGELRASLVHLDPGGKEGKAEG
ncbi:hypothetical protein DFJ73DRAFT_769041 [Zopfochytrium polystomum]|nr:hypothetical protein DFJ73DRAFT_769041 [Zopfochytrium polystomum]